VNPTGQPASASTALARFTVLDLSRVRAGPSASRQLADWGANVIAVEPPPKPGDADPHVGPRAGSDYQNLNRNRRGITLDLKHPEGVAVFKRLAERADVVLENFRPDVKHRLGIDYETLAAVNPRLVYASISGFGQTGPYSKRPGFDQIAQGMAGIMSLTGRPGEGPLRTGIPIADLCAGLFCAQGVLIALLEREVSGRGQWVQTSLVQALAFMLDFQAARWLMDGALPTQHGNHHPTIVPTGTFKAKDGHINLAVVGHVMWERFCSAIGHPEWLAHPDYATNGVRLRHQEQLHAAIEDTLSEHTSEYWVEHFNAHSVPCGPIYTVEEMFKDRQFAQLDMVQSLNGARGEVRYLGQPIALSRTPSAIVRHPPGVSEHTNEVLTAAGYGAQDIARLREANVI